MSLRDRIRQEAQALGFDAVGIARVPSPAQESNLDGASSPPTFLSQLLDRLRTWLDAQFHGSMGWMARDPARRADPAQVLPGCRSVISVGLNYFTGHHADERPGHGRIARYAWGCDYHELLGVKLTALCSRIQDLASESRSIWYVDTGPVMEKAWAQQAGLGWIGKHSNLVSGQYGSWLLLGEVLTTLDLEPDEAGSDLCGSCSLCIHACPTGAIVEPYVVDARRCISYLTIEYRGEAAEIPEPIRGKMGNRIFGCDDCLDVCPYNAQAPASVSKDLQPRSWTLRPDLADLSRMTKADFLNLTDRSPIRRAKHTGFLRNVEIARRNRLPS
jgi:epoxyqueuosine reductase